MKDASDTAEMRIAQTAKVAEANVSTRTESATAGAVRDITASAAAIAKRLEEQVTGGPGPDALEELLERLRDADERMRASEERTREALRHLRAVE